MCAGRNPSLDCARFSDHRAAFPRTAGRPAKAASDAHLFFLLCENRCSFRNFALQEHKKTPLELMESNDNLLDDVRAAMRDLFSRFSSQPAEETARVEVEASVRHVLAPEGAPAPPPSVPSPPARTLPPPAASLNASLTTTAATAACETGSQRPAQAVERSEPSAPAMPPSAMPGGTGDDPGLGGKSVESGALQSQQPLVRQHERTQQPPARAAAAFARVQPRNPPPPSPRSGSGWRPTGPATGMRPRSALGRSGGDSVAANSCSPTSHGQQQSPVKEAAASEAILKAAGEGNTAKLRNLIREHPGQVNCKDVVGVVVAVSPPFLSFP